MSGHRPLAKTLRCFLKDQRFMDKVQLVKLPFCRLPSTQYQEVKEHISDILSQNVIRSSASIYASPIVVVRKKDSTLPRVEESFPMVQHYSVWIQSGKCGIRRRPQDHVHHTIWSILLDTMGMDTSNLLIAGDFNMHMDEGSNTDTKHFLAFLKAADLTQHVEENTVGHTIYLLISRSADTFLGNMSGRSSLVRPLGGSLHATKRAIENDELDL